MTTTPLGYEYTSTEFDTMTPLDLCHYFTRAEQETWARTMKESTLDLIEELKCRLASVQELAKKGEDQQAFLELAIHVKRLRSFSVDLYDEVNEASVKYAETALAQRRLLQHFAKAENS